MSHFVNVNGTKYNVVGGRSLVSGTGYNISKGRTLVNGTGYDISFGSDADAPYAMLYTDGSMVFQLGKEQDSGKTLSNSYTEFIDNTLVPWNSNIGTIKSVEFRDEISPVNLARWFNNARNLSSNISTFTNLNMIRVSNMYCTY